jgi:hypothetical protein
MFLDLFPPISFLIVFRVTSALFIMFIIGFSLGKLFKIDMNESSEVFGIPLVLSINALHLLTYAVFLTRSNLPIYIVFLGSILYLVFSLRSLPSKQIIGKITKSFSALASSPKNIFTWSAFLLFTFIILYNFFRRYGVLEEGENDILKFLANWDDLMLISQMNVSRDFFFPTDNPTLPGEPPYYFSWLGNALPIVLIKFFHIDQLDAYHLWGPIFVQISCFVLILLIIEHFSDSKWTPVFCAIFFFYSPVLRIEQFPLRSQVGLFIVLSTLFFMIRYLISNRKVYLILSFSWIFLYASKGNYMVALFPCFMMFYLKALFCSGIPKWNDKRILAMVPCVLMGLFLFWFSRKYFASTHFFEIEELTLKSFLLKLNKYSGIVFPLIILLFFYGKKIGNKTPLIFIEKLLLVGFISTFLFTIIAGRYLASDSIFLIYLGVLTTLPLILQKLIPNKIYFGMMLIAFFIFPALALIGKTNNSDIEITRDELKMISFLRHETPKDSVFLSNVYRYNDQPALLSSLSYRRQFIDEGGRFAYLLDFPLERRIYDYWNFLMCVCKKEDQIRFINKYPNLNYLIVYENSFLKKGPVIIGMTSNEIFPYPIFKPDPEFFNQVYQNPTITVYEITPNLA